ncbi:ERF family protein [Bradyrhizobium sp. SZCCHNRI3042]|uniref:ERF family protein n=1 Tax=Bradyrhizobium sp. SZCCHNRI3042 TaxID=3057291 RepID=UPI002916FD10|nr:ERF family protein [Bradyrhizobium sp. SZCCHNRI3042]
MTAAAELQVIEGRHSPAPTTILPPNDPMAMIARALERGATPEIIDKLMDWQDRLDKRDAVRSFDAAFAVAKGKFPPIVKDARVNFESKRGGADTDYWHETISGIAEKVDPILAEHGLAYCWEPRELDNGKVEVTCILSHVGGHSRRATLSGAPDLSGNKNHLQAKASAVTYLERYTLKAVLGIASRHDDDGRGGEPQINPDPGRTTQQRAPAPAAPKGPRITAKEAADLEARFEKAKAAGADETQFWRFAQAEKYEDVAADRLPTIISALKSRYGV